MGIASGHLVNWSIDRIVLWGMVKAQQYQYTGGQTDCQGLQTCGGADAMLMNIADMLCKSDPKHLFEPMPDDMF